jgi:hypothetical protein
MVPLFQGILITGNKKTSIDIFPGVSGFMARARAFVHGKLVLTVFY